MPLNYSFCEVSMMFIKRSKVNYVDVFRSFLDPEILSLDLNLRIKLADIDSDYSSRNVYYCTAHVSEKANTADDMISEMFTSVIHEYFEFLDSHYILLRQSEANEIKNIVDKQIILLSKRCYEDIESHMNAVQPQYSALSQSRLAVSRCNSAKIDRYIEKEYKKSMILVNSNQFGQTRIAFFSALSAFLLSIASLIITLIFRT